MRWLFFLLCLVMIPAASQAATLEPILPWLAEWESGKPSQNIAAEIEQCQAKADPSQQIYVFTGEATLTARQANAPTGRQELFGNALMVAEAEAALSFRRDITASHQANSSMNQETTDDHATMTATESQHRVSTESALAQSLGLIVWRSFLAQNSDHSLTAAVCLLSSPALPKLAASMAQANRTAAQALLTPQANPNQASPPPPLAAYYLAHKAQLPNFFGLRLVMGGEGLPILLSFASAHYAPNRNATLRKIYEQNLLDMLTSAADINIAHFVAGSLAVNRTSEASSNYALTQALSNGTASEKLAEISKFTNEFNQKLDYKGLRGLSTLLKWSLPDAEGKNVTIGIIRQWNPWR